MHIYYIYIYMNVRVSEVRKVLCVLIIIYVIDILIL